MPTAQARLGSSAGLVAIGAAAAVLPLGLGVGYTYRRRRLSRINNAKTAAEAQEEGIFQATPENGLVSATV